MEYSASEPTTDKEARFRSKTTTCTSSVASPGRSRLANCQHIELGVQAYTGRYTVLSSPISPLGIGDPVRPLGTLETGNRPGIRDERVAGTLVWYPQPLGFQAEWNAGRGPALNDEQTEVIARSLHGGYVMTMYRWEGPREGVWFPFLRWNYFSGGYKAETQRTVQPHR